MKIKPNAAPEQVSTVAKERMVMIMHKSQRNHDDAKMLLDVLNANPKLDGAFCRLFQINPLPPTP